MTTTDNLDKLRGEIISTYHTIGMCDRAPAAHMRTLYAKHDAAWIAYDAALIRQQEARIAELEQRVEEREADMHARIRAGYDSTVADCWRAKVAELEAENAKLKDELVTLNHDFNERLAKFRALAKRAAELGERREVADNLNADQILDELAEMHKEATDG